MRNIGGIKGGLEKGGRGKKSELNGGIMKSIAGANGLVCKMLKSIGAVSVSSGYKPIKKTIRTITGST